MHQDSYISYLKNMVYDTGYQDNSYRENAHNETPTSTKSNLALELTSNGGDALEKLPISVTGKGQIYE